MSPCDDMRGRWPAVLASLGVPKELLDRSGRRPTCPFCQVKRSYSFNDHNGDGMFFCAHCGPGNGFQLLQKLYGWDFKTALSEVHKVMGTAPVVVERRDVDAGRAARRRAWRSASPIGMHDPVRQYLRGRAITGAIPPALRYHARAPYLQDDGRLEFYAGMIAAVFNREGRPVNIHRTYLAVVEGAWRTAPVESNKRMMPGKVPPGSFIPLGDPVDGAIGIAEGIETALSAAILFNVTCWSAISAHNLEAFEPPEGVHTVMVFGDNDLSFTGQAAAFALAKRLRLHKRFDVSVHIPGEAGRDWNDELRDGSGDQAGTFTAIEQQRLLRSAVARLGSKA